MFKGCLTFLKPHQYLLKTMTNKVKNLIIKGSNKHLFYFVFNFALCKCVFEEYNYQINIFFQNNYLFYFSFNTVKIPSKNDQFVTLKNQTKQSYLYI